jgi:hypothetical protein
VRIKEHLAVATEQGFALNCVAGSMSEIWYDAWVTGSVQTIASKLSGARWPNIGGWGSR